MRAAGLAVSCGKTSTTPAPAPAEDTFAGHDARNAALAALDSGNPVIPRDVVAALVAAYDGNVMVTTLLFDGLAAHRNEEGER